MATYKNLFIDQGSHFSFTLEQDVDLADYSYEGKVRKSYGSTRFTAFSIVSNDDDDALKISLNAQQTANLKAGRYVYDIIIKKTADDTITRVLEGQIDVNPAVTFDVDNQPEINEDTGELEVSTTKTVFTVNSGGTQIDRYAFIELASPYMTYDAYTTSSITISLDYFHLVGADYNNVNMIVITQSEVEALDDLSLYTDGYYTGPGYSPQTLVDGNNTFTLSIPSNEQDAGTFKYLAIVNDRHNTSYSSKFEIQNLEITASTHPTEGQTVSFKSPKTLLNGDVLESGNGHAFDTLSSTTGIFKAE